MKEEEAPNANVQLDTQTCINYWNEFAQHLLDQGKMNAHTAFKSAIPTKLENGWLHVEYHNPLAEDIFTSYKWELQEFFSAKLQGQKIGFKTFLVEEQNIDQKTRLYTEEDKLKYLVEVNPLVAEMRRRFGLDPNS